MIFKIDPKSMIIFILISSTTDYFEIIQRNSTLIRHTLTLTSPLPKFKFKKLKDIYIYPGAKISSILKTLALMSQKSSPY